MTRLKMTKSGRKGRKRLELLVMKLTSWGQQPLKLRGDVEAPIFGSKRSCNSGYNS